MKKQFQLFFTGAQFAFEDYKSQTKIFKKSKPPWDHLFWFQSDFSERLHLSFSKQASKAVANGNCSVQNHQHNVHLKMALEKHGIS